MRLVLLADVKSLGKRGDLVEVADGYARNYLLPRKLAGEADKGAMAKLDAQAKARDRREAQEMADAQVLASRLETAKIAVKAKAGGNGKLFGAVTNSDIAAAIASELSVEIDKHKIELPAQIKALGSYPVEIRLHRNLVAKATVQVQAA
ncbi:MAG: 50S ribosomal protein L9 [Candidatus Eremiobacteraeota bacterium]|nr:50S ribosomal protein L9 [Candidatus Eremiobacteraeota bacterium]MBV9698851.1 50S ribosomal protein L9 [Candidatus Eremiobacteraeota bacterium]